MTSRNDGNQQAERTLAEIESDLLDAEKAFDEADTRLKKAECDRRDALDAVNKHQAEIDEAIAQLRQRSIVCSKWHLDAEDADDVLILQTNDIDDDPVLKSAERRMG